MKKVLFIVDTMEGGGTEKMLVKLVNGFAACNINAELLLGEKRGINLSSINSGITIHEVGGTRLIDYCKSFPSFFKKNNYSHIIAASHFTGAAAIMAKKITGIKSKVYYTHHFAFPANRELRYWKGDLFLKALYYFTAPSADKIIAVSKGCLEWLRKFSHRQLPQGSYIYNPVIDDSIFSMAQEPLHYPVDITGKKILLNVGRLSEQKDQHTLIKAFEIYRKKNPASVLFICGTGPLENEFKQYIQKKKLQNDVILLGYQANPYKWMANCDVFVLSSKYEGFGNVIAEAMALGTTVVSTNCPAGPSEILEDGKLGFLCPVQDAAALANAVEAAVNKPFNREIMKQAGLRYRSTEIVQQYINAL